MRARTIELPTFKELIKIAPLKIQELLEKAKTTQQSKNWHPEGNLYIHEMIVCNRARRTKNINFLISGLLHDLGKVEATKFVNNKWSAHGHEFGSLRLVEKYKDWIENLGANYDIVHYIVKNHMRVKQIHQMRPSKRETFQKEEYFPLANKFSDFDNMQIDWENDIDE